MPDSASDSKRLGDYICAVKANPAHFMLDNHDVEIVAAWLQYMGPHGYDYAVFFKLKVDGKSNGEHLLRKRGIHLNFRPTKLDPTRKGKSYDWYTTHATREMLLLIPSGEIVHWFKTADRELTDANVIAGTYSAPYRHEEWNADSAATMSGPTIHFELPDESRKLP